MRRISLLLFHFVILSAVSLAQPKPLNVSTRAPQVYIELLGTGVYYSANYDQRIGDGEKGLGIRAGLSITKSYSAIPAQINYLVGNQGRYLELGAGLTFATTKAEAIGGNIKGSTILGNATIAYRMQPFRKRGITWRLGFTPLFGNIGSGFWPWVGTSVGYRF